MPTRPTVLVVERGSSLRHCLGLVLQDGGYAVTTLPTCDEALAYLRVCLDPTVVLVSNATPDHQLEADFFAAVAVGGQPLTRHRYVLLTTTPEHVSPALRRQLADLNVPILTKPFTLNRLLTEVYDAACVPHDCTGEQSCCSSCLVPA
jgi:CheY-like chemotaxis protein